MKKLRAFTDFLLFSNIFVAFCAAAITFQTYLIYSFALNKAYILFVFCATLFLYNFQRLILAPIYVKAPGSVRHSWILEHKKPLILLSCISALGMLVSLYYLGLNLLYTILPVGIFSSLYFLPGIHLRKIPVLKSLMVAFIWTLVSIFIPVQLNGNFQMNASLLLLFAERAFFFLSICVVFNIRDMEHDRLSGVRTIPSVYGIKTGIAAGLSGIFMAGICSCLLFLQGTYSLTNMLAVVTSLIITFLLIRKCEIGKSETFYLFGLDGMLPMQLLLVCLFNLL